MPLSKWRLNRTAAVMALITFLAGSAGAISIGRQPGLPDPNVENNINLNNAQAVTWSYDKALSNVTVDIFSIFNASAASAVVGYKLGEGDPGGDPVAGTETQYTTVAGGNTASVFWALPTSVTLLPGVQYFLQVFACDGISGGIGVGCNDGFTGTELWLSGGALLPAQPGVVYGPEYWSYADGTLGTFLEADTGLGGYQINGDVATPEPTTWFLVGAGLAAAGVFRRRYAS